MLLVNILSKPFRRPGTFVQCFTNSCFLQRNNSDYTYLYLQFRPHGAQTDSSRTSPYAITACRRVTFSLFPEKCLRGLRRWRATAPAAIVAHGPEAIAPISRADRRLCGGAPGRALRLCGCHAVGSGLCDLPRRRPEFPGGTGIARVLRRMPRRSLRRRGKS